MPEAARSCRHRPAGSAASAESYRGVPRFEHVVTAVEFVIAEIGGLPNEKVMPC